MPRERWILLLVVAAYIMLATLYSVVTPILEAWDEPWHYPLAKYLAGHGLQLPAQDPANPDPWRQEGSQPPLYYFAGALVTAGIDASDFEQVYRRNPHADIGFARPDGNANVIVHRTDLAAFPWRGTTLAVHILRFFSIGLGAGTILVTYQLAREVFPGQRLVALGAAAMNAFLPMFVFLSASVSNDNLANLLTNLLTLLMVQLLKNTALPHWRSYVVVGAVMGAALLSKLNSGLMILLVAMTLVLVSIRLKNWRPLVVGGAICAALAVAIAGWWYWRNWGLYGDPTGLNRFLDIVGRRTPSATMAQLWSERHSMANAFWGAFGSINVLLPDTVYLIFNAIGLVALLGAVAYVIRQFRHRNWAVERWLPAAVTLVWPLITFIFFLRWTAETPASQGRLLFGALSSLMVWMAVGLTWWLPERLRPAVMASVAGYFALVALVAPFAVIAPAYALPEQIAGGEPEVTFETSEADRGAIGLLEGRILTEEVHPEEYVQVELDWQIVERLSRDWSLFVHLLTPDGVLVAQRDVYPGGGKLATSDMEAGRAWRNPVAVRIPATAYAPMILEVHAGWYHLPTGERLGLAEGAETVMVGQVQLQPRYSELDVPNPMQVNFDNQIELAGYAISDLSPQAGGSFELTLYWRGLRRIERDYVVFAHVIDPTSQRIYAGSDAQPAGWQAPTSSWQPGSLIEDRHTLTVNADILPGTYPLEIGLYWQEADGTFMRLLTVPREGDVAANFVYLSPVRIVEALQ